MNLGEGVEKIGLIFVLNLCVVMNYPVRIGTSYAVNPCYVFVTVEKG